MTAMPLQAGYDKNHRAYMELWVVRGDGAFPGGTRRGLMPVPAVKGGESKTAHSMY